MAGFTLIPSKKELTIQCPGLHINVIGVNVLSSHQWLPEDIRVSQSPTRACATMFGLRKLQHSPTSLPEHFHHSAAQKKQELRKIRPWHQATGHSRGSRSPRNSQSIDVSPGSALPHAFCECLKPSRDTTSQPQASSPVTRIKHGDTPDDVICDSRLNSLQCRSAIHTRSAQSSLQLLFGSACACNKDAKCVVLSVVRSLPPAPLAQPTPPLPR
jgi:hypothetical protein